jgi:hypothetical protein
LVIVEARQINVFADKNLDDSLKLAIARDLQRQLSAALNEPLPPDLQCIIAPIEARRSWRRTLILKAPWRRT